MVNFTTVNPLRGNFFDAMFMLTRLHKNPQTIKLYIQDDCNCDFKKPTHREKKKLENNFRTPDNAVLWQLDDR